MTPIVDKKLYSAIDIILSISSKPSVSPVSSKSISDNTGLGLRYVEQILQILVKKGIVKGVRGINGGYLLAKERRKINLKDVNTAIQGLKNTKKESKFSEYTQEAIFMLNEDITQQINNYLRTITLEEIHNKIASTTSKNKGKNKSDFVI